MITKKHTIARAGKAAPPRNGTGMKNPAPFASDDKLLEAAVEVFLARRKSIEAEKDADSNEKTRRKLRRDAAARTISWHESFSLTGISTPLSKQCSERRLNKIEREILAALLLNQLALTGDGLNTCKELLAFLGLTHKQYIPAMRMLSESGRLFRAKLLSYEDPESDLAIRTPVADQTLFETVLSKGERTEAGWKLKNEDALLDQLAQLTRALMNKSDGINDLSHGMYNEQRVQKRIRQAARLLRCLENTLDRHPQWKLAEIRKEISGGEWIVFLALLGKYLGHVNADDSLFTGGGLARAASDELSEVPQKLLLLSGDRALAQKEFICPCGGDREWASSDAASLESMEFELTAKAIGLLGVENRANLARRGEFQARKPAFRMEQLVLSEKNRQTLNLAIVHARRGARLIDQWGLGEMIPYGRNPAMLFSGPPGTGKTATAEALAHELGRPILVADYSRIQNCYLGQTEKNIVRTFHEAKKQDAVLFWDEADAMFYDRDSARYNWEVRDVNVLLQQLERFDGVCILATNRKITLDKALQRRISLKIEFERPGSRERRQIWERFLPKKLPLAGDVDLDRLCKVDLAGGEIKNVVLNAARLALQVNESGPVTMRDFQTALDMETKHRWDAEKRKQIGFGE